MPTNAFLTTAAIGNREDLADKIYNISPTTTPFQAATAKTKATATLHEWQTDVLAAAGANAVLQGDDITQTYTFTAVTATDSYQKIGVQVNAIGGKYLRYVGTITGTTPSFTVGLYINGVAVTNCSGIVVTSSTPVTTTCGSAANTITRGQTLTAVITAASGTPQSAGVFWAGTRTNY
jgi:hypothetical protein